jgi:hypothetical protein
MIENREWRNAQRQSEAVKEAEKQSLADAKARLSLDIREFESATGLKWDKVKGDEDFNDFVDNDWGRRSILEHWKRYERFSGKTAAAQQERNQRSTGAGGTAYTGNLTPAQQRSLGELNAGLPDKYKMTEKQYMARLAKKS